MAVIKSFCCLMLINNYLIIGNIASQSPTPVVKTSYGDVQGIMDTAGLFQVSSFRGIPFAKPPTGSLRFQRPEKPSSWSGVKNTSDFAASCRQSIAITTTSSDTVPVVESEDCLYLNVFVPGTVVDALKSSKAVMVFIYGGSWQVGNAQTYPANALSSLQDVIVVTLNYRLGLLGFLSSPDNVFPGNVALFDQHAAMVWVKENIAQFGGDSSRITIFGESAGADSVLNHYVSPLSANLFKRAIIQSTPTVGPELITKQAQYHRAKMAASAECGQVQQPQQLMDCLLKLTADQIVSISDRAAFSFYRFVVVDGEFLTDQPHKTLLEGKFDKSKELIIGFMSEDGNTVLQFIPQQFTWDTLITQGISKEQTTNLSKSMLDYHFFQTSHKNSQIMINLLYQNYISCLNNPLEVAKGALDIATDAVFASPTFQVANLVSMNGGTVYLYEFSHMMSIAMKPGQKVKVAGHGHDLYFLFGFFYSLQEVNIPVTAADWSLTRNIMKAFTEFAKTGTPKYFTHTNMTVSWKPYTHGSKSYLLFSDHMTVNSTGPMPKSLQQRQAMWNEVLPGIQSMETCDTYFGPIPTGNGATKGMFSMAMIQLTVTASMFLTVLMGQHN